MFADPRHDELVNLAFAVCDDAAGDADIGRLESLLATDPVTRLLYLQCVELHLELNDRFGEARVCDDFETRYEELRRHFVAFNAESSLPAPFPPPPVVVPPMPAPSSLFVPNVLLSVCVVGAVMLGIGIMIGLRDAPRQPVMATPPPSVTKILPPPPPQTVFVGKIVGMVDCKWDEGSFAVHSKAVALGCKYALTSGVLEIRYDTGARVILQGPVTYVVDSRNSGVLSAGKLTGQVTAESARGLTIRTPTATITDLGTEFGVDVRADGATSAHVFRGAIEVQADTDQDSVGRTFRLTKNESVHVQSRRSVIRHGQADPAAFVSPKQFDEKLVLQQSRAVRWQAYSRRLRNDPSLVAYYTFELRPGDNAVLPNLSSVGSRLDAEIKGAEWVDGRLPGKHALRFHDVNANDRVVLPEPRRFNFPGAFTVAIWFRVERFTEPGQALISKGGFESWRLHRYRETNGLDFSTTDGARAIGRQANIVDGCWHLAVAVYEPAGDGAVKSLYIDGRLEAKKTLSSIRKSNKAVQLGGNNPAGASRNLHNFEGEIDEVAIFSRALSAKEVAAMAAAGDPSDDTVVQRSAENHGP
ncbi:MAG: LamG-like jellyroll fold domain-containing protein [Thermoguttaceae bacterium]